MLFLYKRLPTPTTDKEKIQRIFINMKPEVQPLLSDYATYDLDRFIDKANTIAKAFEIGRKLNNENTDNARPCPDAEQVENKKKTEIAATTLATQNDVIKIIKEELEKFRQSLTPKPSSIPNTNTNNNTNNNTAPNPNYRCRSNYQRRNNQNQPNFERNRDTQPSQQRTFYNSNFYNQPNATNQLIQTNPHVPHQNPNRGNQINTPASPYVPNNNFQPPPSQYYQNPGNYHPQNNNPSNYPRLYTNYSQDARSHPNPQYFQNNTPDPNGQYYNPQNTQNNQQSNQSNYRNTNRRSYHGPSNQDQNTANMQNMPNNSTNDNQQQGNDTPSAQ